MSMFDWYRKVISQYVDFSGRARRSEYWYFALVNIIIGFVLGLVDSIIGTTSSGGFGILGGIYLLAILVPSIAVAARRLHDTGRSGWWLLIGLIPIIGAIVLLVFVVQDSQPGSNQWGPNPKEPPFEETIDEIGRS
jgi:uncharacterized membrane protein YhaH (DUF805 family)